MTLVPRCAAKVVDVRHLSCIQTLKITWGSRVFLLFMLCSGIYRRSSGDECSGFRDHDECDDGRPLTATHPESATGKAFIAMARKLV